MVKGGPGSVQLPFAGFGRLSNGKTTDWMDAFHCGSELARDGGPNRRPGSGSCTSTQLWERPARESGLTTDLALAAVLQSKCGSELAREGGITVGGDVEFAGLFASKPAPTGGTRSHQEPGRLPGRLVVDVDLGRPVNHDGPSRRPTEQCLRSGMPSLGEAPSGGAGAFCLLLTGPASGLLKSEPPSGRNPKPP